MITLQRKYMKRIPTRRANFTEHPHFAGKPTVLRGSLRKFKEEKLNILRSSVAE